MSKTWVIYPGDGDIPPKGGAIPNSIRFREGDRGKGGLWYKLPLLDEPMAHQLVGRVKAYQGDDG